MPFCHDGTDQDLTEFLLPPVDFLFDTFPLLELVGVTLVGAGGSFLGALAATTVKQTRKWYTTSHQQTSSGSWLIRSRPRHGSALNQNLPASLARDSCKQHVRNKDGQ